MIRAVSVPPEADIGVADEFQKVIRREYPGCSLSEVKICRQRGCLFLESCKVILKKLLFFSKSKLIVLEKRNYSCKRGGTSGR
jgi:hypothetical protein